LEALRKMRGSGHRAAAGENRGEGFHGASQENLIGARSNCSSFAMLGKLFAARQSHSRCARWK
jgi:hypothetical protein